MGNGIGREGARGSKEGGGSVGRGAGMGERLSTEVQY